MFERYRIGSKNVVNLIVLLEYCSLSSPVNLMQSVEHWETVNKLGITRGIGVSRPREFHPQPLAELDVNVSAHTAPIIQPFGINPASQCTNADGVALAIRSSTLIVRLRRSASFWYFRISHLVRYKLTCCHTGLIAEALYR